MHALAASCEELHARTGNPPLIPVVTSSKLYCHPRWQTSHYFKLKYKRTKLKERKIKEPYKK
jgi:hypothetical protein